MLSKHLSRKAKSVDRLFHGVIAGSSVVSIVTTLLVVVMLVVESSGIFAEVSPIDFFFGTHWAPLLEPKSFGVLPLVSGTMMILVLSLALALPAGVIVAIYLNEFSPSKIQRIIKPALEVLAGIPTVVYGYFALTWITPSLRTFFPEIQIFNGLSASIVVAIMILPLISSMCDDAFRAVPRDLKGGAYALGATPFEVIFFVLIPAAKTRIFAAVILASSRAVGETMAVTLAAGATPHMGFDPMKSIQTMTAFIAQVSMGDVQADGIEYKSSFAVAALLFTITLTLNIVGGKLGTIRLPGSSKR